MSYSSKAREIQIDAGLRQCTASLKRSGRRQWEFALANGRPLGVSARLLEDWLLLDAPIAEPNTSGDWWDLWRLNASLPGLSKFVLTPDARSLSGGSTNFSLSMAPLSGKTRQTEVRRTNQNVHLRADIPLPDDDDCESGSGSGNDGLLTARLLEACAGLKAAFGRFCDEKSVDHRPAASPVSVENRTGERINELRRLCADSGWPFIERAAGKLMIDLDVQSGFYQAAVDQREAGADVAVEFMRAEDLSEASRRALSLFMLRAGALVMLARPSVEEMENQVAARFEVRFTKMPTATELAHAFSSLSVACAMSAREAAALQDEGIARGYLTMMGARASATAALAGD